MNNIVTFHLLLKRVGAKLWGVIARMNPTKRSTIDRSLIKWNKMSDPTPMPFLYYMPVGTLASSMVMPKVLSVLK
jgi:hypothetical protein